MEILQKKRQEPDPGSLWTCPLNNSLFVVLETDERENFRSNGGPNFLIMWSTGVLSYIGTDMLDISVRLC